MSRTLLPVVSVILFFTPGVSQAEPYLAVREGLMCSACHTNQTGMGKRNLYGLEYSQSDMPIKPTPSNQSGTVLDRALTDFIGIGGDVRVVHNTGFPEVGAQDITNSFLLFEANLYAEIVVKQDRLTIYMDEQVAPGGANSRELVGLLQGLPYGGWVKVGRMNLPYGYRLWDFGYTRSQTNLLGQDFGIELGLEPKHISFQAAISNGEQFSTADTNDGKQLTTRLAVIHPRGRIGGSLSINTQDPVVHGVAGDRIFAMAGSFFGFTGGPLTVLGEIDFIRAYDIVQGDFKVRYAAYGEANLLLSRGLNAKLAFDYFDRRQNGSTAKRFRVGVEPTINEYMQVRVFYDVNRPRNFNDPIFGPNPNQDQLSLELHLMF